MKKIIIILSLLILNISLFATQKVNIKAVAIPLADHYAGIVAYEKYKNKMKYANYTIELLPSPNMARAYFYSTKDSDIAFNVAPMVMDMYAQKPYFKWVSLIHRDGNALVINDIINQKVKLNNDKTKRKPDAKVANAFSQLKKENSKAVEVAVPSFLATHATIFYKYLKDHNKTVSHKKNKDTDVKLRVVKPPKSPIYIKQKNRRSTPVAFEQSLPWPDIAEASNSGKIAWYSKDVLKHKNGHVECIVIARNTTIKTKREALKEVIYYIHQAGIDIEKARLEGGVKLDEIIKMIQKHIPKHTSKAIKESLRADIMAINYRHLNIDENSKESFKEIMNLAFEAGFIKEKVDINNLADDSFSTNITNNEVNNAK